MNDALGSLFEGRLFSGELAGLGLSLALLLALAVSVPTKARGLLRQPIGMLVLYGVVRALMLAAQGLAGFLEPVALLLLLGSSGRAGVLLALDVVLGRRLARPLPRIFRDLVQALVYVAVGIATLRAVGVEPGSLLTTSALLTAVIGLSLQETLGNMFAGLAIQVQRPFEVGDWIQWDAEPKNIGKVTEINWRATKVVTLDHVEIIVPNGTLSKAPIRNYTKPTSESRRSVYVTAPYELPPTRVHELIIRALAETPGVCETPAPTVVTNAFLDAGVEYWVRFFLTDMDRRDRIDSAARDRIYFALRRLGVSIPFPNRTVWLHQVSEESRAQAKETAIVDRERSLARVDLFAVLSAEDRRTLAEMTSQRAYTKGEIVVRQGDDDGDLFLIEEGEVSVILDRPGTDRDVEIARLGPGKFFGEMALMTGDRRSATVKALTDCELIAVGRDAFQRILERSPGIAERVSEVLADRRAEFDRIAEETEVIPSSKAQRTSELLGRIKKLFSLR